MRHYKFNLVRGFKSVVSWVSRYLKGKRITKDKLVLKLPIPKKPNQNKLGMESI
jgi:hypothetical protein